MLKWYQIHPQHFFKKIWFNLVVICHIHYLYEIPYTIAFSYTERIFTLLILDSIFFLDFIFALITPFYDDMLKLVVEEKRIIYYYFSRYRYLNFLLDALNFLPLYMISRGFLALKIFRMIIKFGNIFKMLKELINFVIQLYSFRLTEAKKKSRFVFSFISTLLVFLTLVHMTSCLLIFIGYHSEYDGFSWVDLYSDAGRKIIYLEGVFLVLITLSGVGYGIFQPIPNVIYFYVMFLEVSPSRSQANGRVG